MPNPNNVFGQKSGFPSWEDYIPTTKAQTLIMAIMSGQSYLSHTPAIIDANNMFISIGTMFFFTQDGQYAMISPNSSINQPRIQISHEDCSLVSRYYQFPIPGVNPNLPNITFPDEYIPGIPQAYEPNGPEWIIPKKYNWSEERVNAYSVEKYGPDSICRLVPNLGQPFYNLNPPETVDPAINIGSMVYGYFVPPPPPSPTNPWVIAFHCVGNGKQYSNNPLDTLDYYKYQSLLIRTKGDPNYLGNDEDGYDILDEDNNLLDKNGNKITVIMYLNEVDYIDIEPTTNQSNGTRGYNLTYNTFVFAFRGSKFIPDVTGEVIPPEIPIANINLSNPDYLLKRYRPFLVNKASAMYKSISADTLFTYYYTPFPDDERYVTQKNYPIFLGTLCFTGHSYGGALANILAEYLCYRFPIYLCIQTYSFAPPAYQYINTPPLNADEYNGFLYIRTFINNNDCVPFFKPPNPLDYDQSYIIPTSPPELYAVYHINTINSVSKLELVNKIMLYDGGIPVYLFINDDHDILTGYIGNISQIDTDQFESIINSDFSTGITFGITELTAKKMFNMYLKKNIPPQIAAFNKINSTKSTSEIITSGLSSLYTSLGLNKIKVNYVNLLKSLK
jgi:hypothetical protein